jgi:pimeloyl-ACP methyl ester carboxylesterase
MRATVVVVALLIAAPPARGADVTVRVNGRAVHLDVHSPTSLDPTRPTVVFESGLGTVGTTEWTEVLPLLPATLRFVRYDRPGYGSSEADGEAPTPKHIGTVLHEALAAAGITPPYVLVGHSLGGTRIRMFAGLFPNDVVGLVFVDPTPDFTRRLDDLHDVFQPLGLGQKEKDEMRAAPQSPPPPPSPARAEATMSRAMADQDFREIRALAPLRDIPLVVLAGTSDAEWPTSLPVSFDMHRWVRQWLEVRNASLRRFASSVPRGTFVETTRSSHQIQRSEPELVAWAIQRVLGRN